MSTDQPGQQATSDPLECDIVMKGGITSGIIYPPLVIKLHEYGYSFRNVGGTSAGAIAAAVTAAAEYGKDAEGRGGFEKLKEVREWLSKDGNLRRLFQPSRRTAPLMNTLFGYSQMKKLRWPPLRLIAAFIRHDPLAFVVGAALGVALAVLFALLVTGDIDGREFEDLMRARAIVVLVLFGLAGGLLVGGWHLYHILKKYVPANDFGLCKGRGKDTEKIDDTVLTDWLHVKINDLAGKGATGAGAPLTFGELWKPRTKEQEELKEKGIDLRMMTSNLSQNQPYVLPFEKDLFIFNARELEELFPHNVVDYMVRRARKPVGVKLPADYHFLPEAKDLPVIFAARLSLSFPVLISMVPLYTISQKAFDTRVRCEVKPPPPPGDAAGTGPDDDVEIVQFSHEITVRHWEDLTERAPRKLRRKHMQPNWFSDGGICSNFPIHFFDSWLPRRPTFGVNLTSQFARGVPQEQADTGAKVTTEGIIKERSELIKEHSAVPVVYDDFESAGGGTRLQTQRGYGEAVYLPLPNEVIPPEWIDIDGLGKFLETVFRTAQNYRDNMQAMLPSYRERIVQIRLTDREGGLNLDMDEKTIKEVVRKGEEAGDKLFDNFRLKKHQWVRFRVLMKQMESQLVELNRVMRNNPTYQNILQNKLDTRDYPYVPRDEEWMLKIIQRLLRIGAVIEEFKPDSELFAKDPHPLPDPVLRVTPKI